MASERYERLYIRRDVYEILEKILSDPEIDRVLQLLGRFRSKVNAFLMALGLCYENKDCKHLVLVAVRKGVASLFTNVTGQPLSMSEDLEKKVEEVNKKLTQYIEQARKVLGLA